MSRYLPKSCVALLTVASCGYAATALNSKQFAILSATQGEVSLKGFKTVANATVLPGDTIATGKESAAKLDLDRYSSTTILSDSTVSVLDNTNPGVNLQRGSVVVRDASTNAVRVQVHGAYVLIKGDGSAALCQIEARGTSSRVTLDTGSAEIHGSGAPVFLHPGQYATLALPGRPEGWPQESGATPIPAKAPAGGGDAGRVTREIPRGTLLRGSQTLPLNQNDPVMWNDQVHTLDSGRLQITLNDGSLLSVGSRSMMTIVKHDADSQQTQLQITTGKLRADVAHITKTGGKFEVRTKTAVIGVVGTSFLVDAENRRTRICGVEGETTVQNAQGTPQTVTVHKGECTFVGLQGVPSNPQLNPSVIANLAAQTTLNVAAAAGGVAASTAAIVVTVTASAAATAGGIAAGTVLTSGGTNLSPSAQ